MTYSQFLETIPDAVLVVDGAGKIVLANSQAEAMFGYQPGELPRQTFGTLVTETSRAQLPGLFDRPGTGSAGSGQTLSARRQDGTEFLANLQLKPIVLEAASLTVCVIRGLTARLRAEDAPSQGEEPFGNLTRMLPEAVYILDLGQQKVTYFNHETFLGYSRAELMADTSILGALHPEDGPLSLARGQRTTGGEMGAPSEYRLRNKTGDWEWVQSREAVLARQADGTPAEMLIVLSLITPRKRAEAALVQSEARFSRIFVSSPIPITLSRLADGVYLDANDAFLRLSGFTRDEVLGHTPQELNIYPDPAMRTGLLSTFREHGRVEGIEQPFRTKSGAIVDTRLWLQAITIRDEACILALALDVTEQMQADTKLRQLSRAVEQSPATIVLTDTSGNIQYVNPKFTQTTGYSLEEAIGQNPRLLKSGETPPEAYQRLWATITAGGEWRGEFHNRKKNGELYWESATLSPIFDASGRLTNFLAVKEDITERKQAEAALRVSEQRYRGLFAGSPIALWEEDFSAVKQRLEALQREGHPDLAAYLRQSPEVVAECAGLIRLVDINSSALKLYGARSQADFEGALPKLVLSGPDESFLRELVSIARGEAAFESESPFQTLTGERVFLSLHWSALPGSEETLARVILYAIDITERERANEALAQERNLLRTLIDNLPHVIYVKDTQGRFVIKNLADARQMGATTPDETIGKTDFDFYPAELAAQYYADDQAVIASGQAIVNREEPIIAANGRTGWMSTTKVPLRDRQGNIIGLVGIGHDITESKRAEEEIKQRLAELEAVNRVSTAMRTAQDLDDMLPRLLAEAVAIVGGNTGGIWLFDPDSDELWLACERNWGSPEKRFKRGESVPGHVLATGQAYWSRDLQQDPHIPEANRGRIPAGAGGVCVPIRAAHEISGVLYITSAPPREFSLADVHLLTTLAEIAGNAIQRMRLHEQTERRLRQLTALRAIDLAISSSLDLPVTLSVLVSQVMAQLQVDAADVLLLDEPARAMVSAASRGFRLEPVGNPSLPLGQGYASRIALDRSLIALPEGADEAPHAGLLPPGEGFRAYYGVPLISNGQVAGVLEIYHRSPLHPDTDWLEFLEALAGQAAIAIDNARLVDGLQRSNFDLSQAYEATIEGWSRALDLRDKETEGHSQRVTSLTLQLAVTLGMQAEQLVHVRRGALLHDIGKMGVPDRILLKPGPLTADEWVVMRLHPQFAYDMLAPIEYLHAALDIPYGHHEKWDGTGYPQRLAGEQIPLAARIFAVVDVWDALRSDRPYRPAWPADRVREYLQSMAGTHFDPRLVPIALESILVDDPPLG